MTFWILCNGHADSLGVKKQVGQKWPVPVVKGLKCIFVDFCNETGAVKFVEK